jgi:hypothetical protein
VVLRNTRSAADLINKMSSKAKDLADPDLGWMTEIRKQKTVSSHNQRCLPGQSKPDGFNTVTQHHRRLRPQVRIWPKANWRKSVSGKELRNGSQVHQASLSGPRTGHRERRWLPTTT